MFGKKDNYGKIKGKEMDLNEYIKIMKSLFKSKKTPLKDIKLFLKLMEVHLFSLKKQKTLNSKIMSAQDLNLRPSGYEPDELPDCSTPRQSLAVILRPGNDLLSRALRQSTIGAEGFHDRVRNGIGCSPLAITTGP